MYFKIDRRWLVPLLIFCFIQISWTFSSKAYEDEDEEPNCQSDDCKSERDSYEDHEDHGEHNNHEDHEEHKYHEDHEKHQYHRNHKNKCRHERKLSNKELKELYGQGIDNFFISNLLISRQFHNFFS